MIHLQNPTPDQERSIRFVRQHTTNLVICLQSGGLLSEQVACDVSVLGFFEALAERIVAEADPARTTAAIHLMLIDSVQAAALKTKATR
ncbi:MAG TPA: hypothetical protein VGG48_01690 [Rhizomicrobium sp.]